MVSEATVFVVDDDQDMRESLRWLLESAGYRVELFESAEEFLQRPGNPSPGCMLLDVRMPGMGGLRLLERLSTVGPHLPVIMVTAHGDVPMAVNAVKSGAFDFIEKPAAHQLILDRVRAAVTIDTTNRQRDLERQRFNELFSQLSQREREVMSGIVNGDSNKVMALAMGISERTVEKHRESLMQKMGTRSLAAVIRMGVLHGTYKSES
ncbi:MAG: response regulator [Methylotetracoccus sp.]